MGVIPTSKAYSQMPETDRMQALSLAYARAIAAKAGANVSNRENDYGIDMSFTKIVKRNNRYTDTCSIPVHTQVKASTLWGVQEDTIFYDLEVKNYNDLVNSSICVLILLCLPPYFDEWLYQDEDCLRIHKCCYYWRPSDHVETTNNRKKRIFISKSQIFSTEALTELMNEVQLGVKL
jgi:hypothetical protein